MSLHHFARGAIAAENSRRLMMLRGYTPNGHRLWEPAEAGNLKWGYPDYSAVLALNTRRSRPAHHSKAVRMGITRGRAPDWSVDDLYRLHRLFPRASRLELVEAFPNRSWGAIYKRARRDGYRRPRGALKATGHMVLDQLLLRAVSRNVSLRELDLETQSKSYFSRRKWKGKRLNLAYLTRAAAYLGGRLRVRWDVED